MPKSLTYFEYRWLISFSLNFVFFFLFRFLFYFFVVVIRTFFSLNILLQFKWDTFKTI